MQTFTEKKAETPAQYENELQLPKLMHKINTLVEGNSPCDMLDSKGQLYPISCQSSLRSRDEDADQDDDEQGYY